MHVDMSLKGGRHGTWERKERGRTFRNGTRKKGTTVVWNKKGRELHWAWNIKEKGRVVN
jgi:hypothetical protein